jgi:regulator of sigma E protease
MHVGSIAIGPERIGQAGLEPYLGPNVKITVVGVSPGSPAAEAGLQARDQIIKVNGKPVDPSANPASGAPSPDVLHSRFDVIRTIQGNPDQPVTLTVLRNGEAVDVTATPRIDSSDGKPRIGFTPGIIGEEVFVSRLGPGAALKHAFDENIRAIQLTKQLMGQLFQGKRSPREIVTGPVGIFELVGQASEDGAMPVLQMMGLLSLNLGIFNLLPIPVLDGGLIFMLGLEAVLGLFGLPLTLRAKERMMQVGMLMLVLLMGFVIFNDISKRFNSSRVTQPPAAEQPKK